LALRPRDLIQKWCRDVAAQAAPSIDAYLAGRSTGAGAHCMDPTKLREHLAKVQVRPALASAGKPKAPAAARTLEEIEAAMKPAPAKPKAKMSAKAKPHQPNPEAPGAPPRAGAVPLLAATRRPAVVLRTPGGSCAWGTQGSSR
jgi:hypothetical protein